MDGIWLADGICGICGMGGIGGVIGDWQAETTNAQPSTTAAECSTRIRFHGRLARILIATPRLPDGPLDSFTVGVQPTNTIILHSTPIPATGSAAGAPLRGVHLRIAIAHHFGYVPETQLQSKCAVGAGLDPSPTNCVRP